VDSLIKYRTEVDGLRAFAVLSVILYHAEFSFISGGFTGVDVFFVISGYLITLMLIKTTRNDSFSFVHFYERRVRRLFPTLFIVTIFCIPISAVLMLPREFKEFLSSIFFVNTFTSNIFFWEQGGYFGEDATLKPLLHTWSLAIEEQYYLIFPIVFIFLYGRVKEKTLLFIMALVWGLSLLTAEVISTIHPRSSFFLIPTRAWELLTGSFIALLLSHSKWFDNAKRFNSSLLSFLGVFMVLLGFVIIDSETTFPGFWTLLPVIGTALIILFSGRENMVGRMLSYKAFVYVGLVSYSAYLWHYPLFVFARMYYDSNVPVTVYVALTLLTFVLSHVTTFTVEKYSRNPRNFEKKEVWGYFTIFTATLIAFSLYSGRNYEWFWLVDDIQSSAVVKTIKIIDSPDANNEFVAKDNNSECIIFGRSGFSKEQLVQCKAKHGEGLFIVGDSHALDLYKAAKVGGISEQFVVVYARGGCRPNDIKPYCHYNDALDFLSEFKSFIALTVFHQSGAYLMETPSGKTSDRNVLKKGGQYPFEPMHENIRISKKYVTALTEFSDVIWLGPRIEHHLSKRKLISQGCSDTSREMDTNVKVSFLNLDKYLETQSVGFTYISLINVLNFSSGTDILDCNNAYFLDGDHWSNAGAYKFGRLIDKALLNSREL
jgi:peptidoglycan/LPS O-acetylase OafA/YrhL